MVLAELGDRIARAIRDVSNAVVVDENVLNECLNEIERALLQADVHLKLVQDMVANVRKEINLSNMAPGLNKRKITEQAICHELCRMLDAGKPSFTPKKMKTSVIMFVGLQGSGKTTTCTKYANYYQKKGWRPALVCADTYRAGAFDQLKQNANKANIPYYGSYYESDPVKTAMEGVEKFRKENRDLIIIDTSGRHKQEEALFEEMRQLSEATQPDLVVFVMDSSIGQAAFGQAEAFKKSVPVGAVIVTKMDGHAKGGGALSAVAATKSPVLFIGTGEHMDQLEAFDARAFVQRLLGKGDLSKFAEEAREVVSLDQQKDLLEQLTEGAFTLRKYQSVLKMKYQCAPMLSSHVQQSMLRGHDELNPTEIKKQIVMMDSMTREELDSLNVKLMNQSRIMRIARGAGCAVKEVMDLTEEFKHFGKTVGKKNLPNILQMMSRLNLGIGGSSMQNMMKQLSSGLGR